MRKIFERYLTVEKTLRYNLRWNGRYPRCVPELNKNRLKVDIVSTIQKKRARFKGSLFWWFKFERYLFWLRLLTA